MHRWGVSWKEIEEGWTDSQFFRLVRALKWNLKEEHAGTAAGEGRGLVVKNDPGVAAQVIPEVVPYSARRRD